MTGRGVRVVAVCLAMVVALLPACSDSVDSDEARLTVSGIVTLTPPDGGERTIDRGQTVDFGDVINVVEGTASIELANGDRYELRAGRDGARSTRFEVGEPPRLLAGEVLISDSFPAVALVGDTTITARGPTRIHAEVPSVTSFAGETQIGGVANVTQVQGLRTVVLEADATQRPLQIDIADPWDRRYLEDVYAFGQRLEALSLGYTADLQSNTEATAAFFSSVLPELGRESEFTDDLLTPGRPAGETLVGAAIVLTGQDGTFRERWVSVFAFRDQGASWGLVAADNGVRSAPVADSIEVAVGASPLSGDPPVSTTTTTAPDEPDVPVDTPESTVPPTTAPPTTIPPTSPPTTEPEPDGVLGGVLTPVGDLLDGILEALGLGDDEDTPGSEGR